MTDREKELEEKLRDRELSLLRAWDALQKVRAVLGQYTGPGRVHGAPKSFEAEGEFLANGLRKLIQKSHNIQCARFDAMNNVMTYLGRPVPEKEMERFIALQGELLFHMDGMGQYTDGPEEDSGLDVCCQWKSGGTAVEATFPSSDLRLVI